MKKILLLAVVLTVSVVAIAEDRDRKISIFTEFKPATLLAEQGDNVSLFGVSAGADLANWIGNFEFDISGAFQHSFGSSSTNGVSNDYKMFIYTFDIHFGYIIDIKDTKIAVTPLFGLGYENMFSGTVKSSYGGYSNTLNMRKVEDMGTDGTFSSTLYLSGGAKVYIGDKFFARLRYAHSVMNYSKHVGYQFVGIGVGYIF